MYYLGPDQQKRTLPPNNFWSYWYHCEEAENPELLKRVWRWKLQNRGSHYVLKFQSRQKFLSFRLNLKLQLEGKSCFRILTYTLKRSSQRFYDEKTGLPNTTFSLCILQRTRNHQFQNWYSWKVRSLFTDPIAFWCDIMGLFVHFWNGELVTKDECFFSIQILP